MYGPLNQSRLKFEKRVVGSSVKKQVEPKLLSSRAENTNDHSTSQLRASNSCVSSMMEMLTSDPPLFLEPQSTSAVHSRLSSGNGFFSSRHDDSDSVVLEMGEPATPMQPHQTPMCDAELPRLSPTTPPRVGAFSCSPKKPRRAREKTREKERLHPLDSKGSLPSRGSVGGVTLGSVTRSQDSIEKGPMRVSLAHKALIGKGSYGVVFQAMDLDTNHIIAVKEIALHSSTSNDQAARMHVIRAVRSELALLKQLDHPHIVKCLGEECDEDHVRIYLEYVSGGSISSLLRTFGPFREKQAEIYTRQILEGLIYLHSRHIVHRDLKGDNLLVDPHGILKISDFGTAKELLDHNATTPLAGTAYFMAPEVILGQCAGLASDVWSVGCCVIEMLTGRPPFADVRNQYALMMRVAESSGELFPGMLPKTREHELSAEAIAFLQRCLQRDPAARPSAKELLTDPWIQNLSNSLDFTTTSVGISSSGGSMTCIRKHTISTHSVDTNMTTNSSDSIQALRLGSVKELKMPRPPSRSDLLPRVVLHCAR